MREPLRRHPVSWDFVALFVLGVAAVLIAECLRVGTAEDQGRMLVASARMEAGIEALSAYRLANGPLLNRADDVNGTGLIGIQFSPMTTTVGDLEAKRTTTNPNMAGLMVFLLAKAGVREGDFIAVGASGSFPALILATLCAADAMNLDLGLIVSLGASQWGANLPDFTWLDMEDVLYRRGIAPWRCAAASVGGDLDTGRDLAGDVRAGLRSRIEASAATLIDQPDLVGNVALRQSVYRSLADGRPIAAFVNIGGSWANVGADASILNLSPGVNHIETLPPPDARGVVHAMAEDGMPIIHLLNIKELAQRFRLPWDPSPLPEPGSLRALWMSDGVRIGVSVLAASYLGIVTAWLLWIRLGRRGRKRTGDAPGGRSRDSDAPSVPPGSHAIPRA
jgi:poly-gamma-glutamate system protein